MQRPRRSRGYDLEQPTCRTCGTTHDLARLEPGDPWLCGDCRGRADDEPAERGDFDPWTRDD